MVRLSGLAMAIGLVGAVHGNWLEKRDDINKCLKNKKVPYLADGDENWETDGTAFNLRLNFTAAAVAVPRTTKQVQSALKCGVKEGVRVSPKGGGHNYASMGFGGEDGQLVIVLDRMKEVKLNKKDGTATIQGGARLGGVATQLWEQGKRALPHGTCPAVGVGGHVLHGGYGHITHHKGLTLDSLIGAEVILADGSIVQASEKKHADLFWALRGAGGGFGIVTEFKFKTFAAPENVVVYNVATDWDEEGHVEGFKKLQDWVNDEMPSELAMRVGLGDSPAAWEGNYYGTEEQLAEILAPIMEATGVHPDNLTMESTDWIGQVGEWLYDQPLISPVPYDYHEYFYANSLTAPYLSDEAIENFFHYKYNNVPEGRGWWIQWDMHGGKHSALAQVPNDATAYAHRDQLWLWQFYDYLNNGEPLPEEPFEFLQGFVRTITDTLEDGEWGKYINYADSELEKEEAQKLYWRSNLPRLQQIKKKYDPNEVFWHISSVSPAA